MQFYSASFLGDMREVVAHVTKRYPKANVYAVGWSLGGNILVNYLGQVKVKQYISVPITLYSTYWLPFCLNLPSLMEWGKLGYLIQICEEKSSLSLTYHSDIFIAGFPDLSIVWCCVFM